MLSTPSIFFLKQHETKPKMLFLCVNIRSPRARTQVQVHVQPILFFVLIENSSLDAVLLLG